MQNGPVAKRKLSDEVFDRLKRMIVDDAMKPGSNMPSERELMLRLGVGRPVIREAMQALSSMGMVEINHGERARVLEFNAQSMFRQLDQSAHIMLQRSAESLEHLKSARLFFERGMVREAALKATPEDLDELRKILEEQRHALGDVERFMAADMQFHKRIAACSGNPIFVAVSEGMLGWLHSYHTEMLLWTGKEKYTLAEHEEIISHLAANDPEAAEAAMVKHLDRSRALYVLPGQG
ncbi:transcriptional regulator NanR [Aestuariivirga litoralis]|uniref:transcriptional regulator NanR n=1 Tax=Aestuariivirga litoralis TaxID=2650924 RepID=UPI0018C6FA2C|nr:transcriptional regulator NanR [Aestuariivirga litoralis]MBG1232425.1 transcriptional regulator NanR [Aestuariivirga litoralis]